MSQEPSDPLRSKSLPLHKRPTLLESKFRLVGLDPQLLPVKASTRSLYSYSMCHHHHPHRARARPIQYSIPLRGQLQRVDCSTSVRLGG